MNDNITDYENKEYYFGSVKWLIELNTLNIPIPKIFNHGEYKGLFYTLISYITGKDIGDVYHILTDFQKQNIAKELSIIQYKVSTLPSLGLYGYPHSSNNQAFATWIEYLEKLILRSRERIIQNKIFDVSVCDTVTTIMFLFEKYFKNIKPTPFLDDITTKNVLIHDGKLSGIVDIDELCFGDSLSVIGLTNMALLSMKADTNYIDFWLNEINANDVQRKAVLFYTLLSCIDFMGEQGMKFSNDKIIPYNQKKVEILNFYYHRLLGMLS